MIFRSVLHTARFDTPEALTAVEFHDRLKSYRPASAPCSRYGSRYGTCECSDDQPGGKEPLASR
jgi:hypothetical protein